MYDISTKEKTPINIGADKHLMSNDPVNNPEWYTSHPSGIECIQIVEHMSFCLGNAIKYIWRAELKSDKLQDLRKAEYYIRREIERIEREKSIGSPQ